MTSCPYLPQIENWAKQGSLLPLPKALSGHGKQCTICANFIQSVGRARELGQLLPTTTIPRSRHDEMKFRLMAEARQNRPNGGTVSAPRNLRVRVLAMAAIVVSVAGAAAAHHFFQVPVLLGRGSTPGAMEARPFTHVTSPGLSTHSVAPSLSTNPWNLAATIDVPPPAMSATTASTQNAPRVAAQSRASADTGDSEFTRAWKALRTKRPAEAAKRFDALLASPTLDAARRADILYWSAQSHRQAGNTGQAMSRSTQLIRQFPSAPFAADAALMLGEFALASDKFELAKRHLTKAASSQHAVVRERARRALEKLAKAQQR